MIGMLLVLYYRFRSDFVCSLAVAPQTPTVRKERELIEATSKLGSFNVKNRAGVPLSPIEIRMSKDKLSLIKDLLESNGDAYRHPDVLMELVTKLGYRGDKEAELRVLYMTAMAATRTGDHSSAADTCFQMVGKLTPSTASSSIALVCAACTQIGGEPKFVSTNRKRQLLAHALLLCPEDEVATLLVDWRVVDQLPGEVERSTSVGPSLITHTAQEVPSINPLSILSTIKDSSMMHSLKDSAMLNSIKDSAQAGRWPSSLGLPERAASPAAALDSLIHGREGGVRDKLSNRLHKGMGWLVGEE